MRLVNSTTVVHDHCEAQSLARTMIRNDNQQCIQKRNNKPQATFYFPPCGHWQYAHTEERFGQELRYLKQFVRPVRCIIVICVICVNS